MSVVGSSLFAIGWTTSNNLVLSAVAGSVSGVGDPRSTRIVYAMVIGLALVGLLFIWLGIWVVRQTRVDREMLSPLERMGDREWRKSDPASQRRSLDEVRPPGAEPLQPEPHEPRLDSEFDQADRPVQSFDDLGSIDPEGADPTPAGVASDALDKAEAGEPEADGAESGELEADGAEADGAEGDAEPEADGAEPDKAEPVGNEVDAEPEAAELGGAESGELEPQADGSEPEGAEAESDGAESGELEAIEPEADEAEGDAEPEADEADEAEADGAESRELDAEAEGVEPESELETEPDEQEADESKARLEESALEEQASEPSDEEPAQRVDQ